MRTDASSPATSTEVAAQPRTPPAGRTDTAAEGLPVAEPQQQPRLRVPLRLRTVLIFLSLSVLVVPLLGVLVLRLHEDTLLRQTQDELGVVANLLSSSYRARLAEGAAAEGATVPTAPASPAEAEDAASKPELDFANTAPPFPGPVRAGPPDPAAARVGAHLASVVEDARRASDACIRILDASGVVVASTEDDVGLSLAHVAEVREALGGVVAGALRRASAARGFEIQPLVRGASVEVNLATPVLLAGRVVGVVTTARRPSTIVDTLVNKRNLLLQGAAVFLVVAVGVAIVTARTLVLPIQRLRRGVGRVSRGETEHFERGRHYRVHELAELADSIEAMVLNLQQRTRYLREFARQVNHEFKTPIAAARGAVELLSDHLPDMTERQARHFVDNLATDVARLERLAERLLALAQADLAAASTEVVDVHAVARTLASPALRVAEGQALARMPHAALRVVLENLLENALEQGATRVDVRATRQGGKVMLRVQDDGPGIAPAHAARVFDPFYTTRADRGGTGLGLAICRALVQNAGGRIALAQSDAGTAFTITLDAAQQGSP